MQAICQPLLWIIAVAAAAGLVRSESPPQSARPTIPAAYHIHGVPFAEPHRDWCGPAALAAVLQYHGEDVNAQQIADDIHLPHYRGSLTLDLLLWARKRGCRAWARTASADLLKRAIARDRPAICLLRKRGRLADRNHFVVVRGYEDDPPVWLLDAGERREQRVANPDFERDWQHCGGWMLVVEGKTPPHSEHHNASR